VYSEEDDTDNHIPNADFAQGLEGWGAWGQASPRLLHSDRGAGYALHLAAQPDQEAAINSAKFPTTPEASFSVSFVARLSSITGHGYFNSLRQRVAAAPIHYPLAGCRFPLKHSLARMAAMVSRQPWSPAREFNWFPGDESYWPAFCVSDQSGE
jgi:hypothetical protein